LMVASALFLSVLCLSVMIRLCSWAILIPLSKARGFHRRGCPLPWAWRQPKASEFDHTIPPLTSGAAEPAMRPSNSERGASSQAQKLPMCSSRLQLSGC
jgi:hypothetical protein